MGEKGEAGMRYALALCFILAGCAGAVPWNPQNNAGITNVEIEWQLLGEQPHIRSIHWRDGKEKQSVTLAADLNLGTLNYSATSVSAFKGFESRAQVEMYVAEKFASAAPDIRVGLVEVIAKLAGL